MTIQDSNPLVTHGDSSRQVLRIALPHRGFGAPIMRGVLRSGGGGPAEQSGASPPGHSDSPGCRTSSVGPFSEANVSSFQRRGQWRSTHPEHNAEVSGQVGLWVACRQVTHGVRIRSGHQPLQANHGQFRAELRKVGPLNLVFLPGWLPHPRQRGRGMADRIGVDMTDRDFVLKWAHLGRGRPRPLRHREIIESERRAFVAHVAEIQAEQQGLDGSRNR